MKVKNIKAKTVIAGILAALIMLGVAFNVATTNTVNIHVTDKERINKADTSYYLVFTEGEVFKNDDSFINFKFDSSDLQGQLKIGGDYTCRANWFRVSFLSMYRNLLSCQEN